MEVIGLSICGGVQISAATFPVCFVCMRVFFDLLFDPSWFVYTYIHKYLYTYNSYVYVFTFCSSLSMFGCFDRCPLPGNAPLRHTWPNALKLQQSIGVTWNVFKGAGHRVVATCRVVANVFSCVCLGSVRVCGHVMTCCHSAEELIKLCVCVCASEGWQKMQPAWASLRLLSHLIHEAIFHLNGTVCETIWMFRCCDMMRCAPCFLSSLMLNSGKDESEDAVDAIIRTASTMRPQTLSVSRPCSRVSGWYLVQRNRYSCRW